jgi:4-oxalocrotonate tautomerase
MPTINIQMFEGRSREQRHALAKAITETTCRVLEVPPESVEIIISEVARENWISAGKPWSDADRS